MNPPYSSARLQQNKQVAAFLASQKLDAMASQKTEEPQPQAMPEMACQKSERSQVQVSASQGKGQQSKTVKINDLKFRVRLNDNSYRVMLLLPDGEPYLVSLLKAEWKLVEKDSAAFLEKVTVKLRVRIGKADEELAAKLKTLLTTIEEANK